MGQPRRWSKKRRRRTYRCNNGSGEHGESKEGLEHFGIEEREGLEAKRGELRGGKREKVRKLGKEARVQP
jgi:hypothetical protein